MHSQGWTRDRSKSQFIAFIIPISIGGIRGTRISVGGIGGNGIKKPYVVKPRNSNFYEVCFSYLFQGRDGIIKNNICLD